MLELIATGHRTADVLEAWCGASRLRSTVGLCSLLLLEGRRFHVALAPSLPAAYNAAIEGLEIGPEARIVRTAAYHNRTVVVSDIATDPLWAGYRDVALPHGLRACWSVPLRAPRARCSVPLRCTTGTPRAASPAELTLVERAASLAAIAVERERRENWLASVNRNVAEGLYRNTTRAWLVYANRAFATMFGYENPEQMLAVAFGHAVRRSRTTGRTEAPDRDTQGSFENEEVQFRRRDGSQFTALARARTCG